MPVEFQQFPANWRQPLYYVEVDPSRAGLPVSNPIALIVGYANQEVPPSPLAPVNPQPSDVPIVIGSLADATQYFGPGSMLESAFRAFFANNFGTLVFALPILQPVGGVAASGAITVTSPPTQQGILNLYVAGQLCPVSIMATDTTTTAAAAIADAINALTSLPVTATSTAAVVTVTCKWTGLTGNDVDLRDSYLGKYGGQFMPIGMAVTYPTNNKLAGGIGNPNFTNGIANLGDQEYEYVSMPFMDTGSITTWDAEYGFTDNGRWGWARQQYGTVFSAYRDTYANLVIWGEQNNSAVISVMAMEPDIPSPSWEVAAAYTSKGARSYMNDPARPLQTLELTGVLPPPKHKRFLLSQLNNLSYSGLATQRIDANNIPMIARESMMYQKNVYGIPDDAYELGTTLHTLAKLFRNQRQAITSKYPRHKLADDGTRYGVGQAIVTPSVIRAELVAEYAVDEYNGLVENLNAFKQNLVVERDPNNPNRANVIYPPDLVNQLRIFAVLAQFRLQYNRGVDQVIAAG
jgi:phage tail sheath gpL-like